MKTKKLISIIFLITLVFASSLFFKSKISYATPNTDNLSVIPSDLEKAGFSSVKQDTPLPSGRFSGPAYYFETGDRVSNSLSEASNIVMVYGSMAPAEALSYTYGSDSHAFDIVGGQGKEGKMFDDRVAINFVKNGHYVVIIGPNKKNIETLASLLAQKIQ